MYMCECMRVRVTAKFLSASTFKMFLDLFVY